MNIQRRVIDYYIINQVGRCKANAEINTMNFILSIIAESCIVPV